MLDRRLHVKLLGGAAVGKTTIVQSAVSHVVTASTVSPSFASRASSVAYRATSKDQVYLVSIRGPGGDSILYQLLDIPGQVLAEVDEDDDERGVFVKCNDHHGFASFSRNATAGGGETLHCAQSFDDRNQDRTSLLSKSLRGSERNEQEDEGTPWQFLIVFDLTRYETFQFAIHEAEHIRRVEASIQAKDESQWKSPKQKRRVPSVIFFVGNKQDAANAEAVARIQVDIRRTARRFEAFAFIGSAASNSFDCVQFPSKYNGHDVVDEWLLKARSHNNEDDEYENLQSLARRRLCIHDVLLLVRSYRYETLVEHGLVRERYTNTENGLSLRTIVKDKELRKSESNDDAKASSRCCCRRRRCKC